MKNALAVSGHPRLGGDSVANAAIVGELAKLDGYEVDRLDALYPGFAIDVEAEQAKLAAADVVVLQYPVFWYGMPALLQKWMEDVFAHGFSHGSKGKALVGKRLVVSMTVGAPEEAYGGPCALSDGFDGLREKVLAADMLVLATPLYYYGMTARSGYPEAASRRGRSLG